MPSPDPSPTRSPCYEPVLHIVLHEPEIPPNAGNGLANTGEIGKEKK